MFDVGRSTFLHPLQLVRIHIPAVPLADIQVPCRVHADIMAVVKHRLVLQHHLQPAVLVLRGLAAEIREIAARPVMAERRQLWLDHNALRRTRPVLLCDPENGWKARYEILPGKEKVADELRKLAHAADVVYLATDLDREGEAISWHLHEILKERGVLKDKPVFRAKFFEITKKEIQNAIASPEQLSTALVEAQKRTEDAARRAEAPGPRGSRHAALG